MEPHTDTSNPQGAQLTSGLHSASEDLRDLLRSEVPEAAVSAVPERKEGGNGPFVAAIVLAVVSFASLFAPIMHFRGEEAAKTVQTVDPVVSSTVAALD